MCQALVALTGTGFETCPEEGDPFCPVHLEAQKHLPPPPEPSEEVGS